MKLLRSFLAALFILVLVLILGGYLIVNFLPFSIDPYSFPCRNDQALYFDTALPNGFRMATIRTQYGQKDIFWTINGKQKEIKGYCSEGVCRIILDDLIFAGGFTNIGYINLLDALPDNYDTQKIDLHTKFNDNYRFSQNGQWLAVLETNKNDDNGKEIENSELNLFENIKNTFYPVATKKLYHNIFFDIDNNGNILVNSGETHNKIQLYTHNGIAYTAPSEFAFELKEQNSSDCISTAKFWTGTNKIIYSMNRKGYGEVRYLDLETNEDNIVYKQNPNISSSIHFDISTKFGSKIVFSEIGEVLQIDLLSKTIEVLTGTPDSAEISPKYYGDNSIVFWSIDQSKGTSEYSLETIDLLTKERKLIMTLNIDTEKIIVWNK